MKTIVTITSAQRDIAITPLRRTLCRLVQDVLEYEKIPPTRVHIAFLNDSEVRSLHKKYFDDPSPTDCMTFPVDSVSSCGLPGGFLGEIVVCPKTARLFNDPVSLYVVHALLHLIGYTDTTDRARQRMKRQERMHMMRLEKKGLTI